VSLEGIVAEAKDNVAEDEDDGAHHGSLPRAYRIQKRPNWQGDDVGHGGRQGEEQVEPRILLEAGCMLGAEIFVDALPQELR
jgi:hypothetical protein